MLTSHWRGLALLLAAFLPLILWRARLESSFWLDEVYSALHGPRYPGLVAVLWLAGLALIGLGAGRVLGWRPGRSSLALLPLLACSITGQWLLARQEAGGGLAAALEVHRDLLPAPGAPLYVMPPSSARSTGGPWPNSTFAGSRSSPAPRPAPRPGSGPPSST